MSNQSTMIESDPPSPCINVCVLDPVSGYCRGCYRTGNEIAAWRDLDAAAKQAVLDQLDSRVNQISA